MAKLSKWEKQHRKDVAKYQRRITAIFDEAAQEAAKIGASIDAILPEGEIFSFDKFPLTKAKVDKVMNTLRKEMQATIVSGIRSEWTLANSMNDELCNVVFGDTKNNLSPAQRKRYYSTNGDAQTAFIDRKNNGLNLSDNVWNYTNQFKSQIEAGLDVGIRNGQSAKAMTKDLKTYLKHPDKLFRRVRDIHGHLKASKAMAIFHPGRGVYRSSYKNALRLTVTETNMAYRMADHQRHMQMDFIVGIRVVLSNNHPVPDICDELSAPAGSKNRTGRGCYPKDFVFTGWHPFCRCHVETILKTDAELAEDAKRIREGKEPAASNSSQNAVLDTPKEFKDWVRDNETRVATMRNKPYFVNDNKEYFDEALNTKSK
jgi:hypothetical protein